MEGGGRLRAAYRRGDGGRDKEKIRGSSKKLHLGKEWGEVEGKGAVCQFMAAYEAGGCSLEVPGGKIVTLYRGQRGGKSKDAAG